MKYKIIHHFNSATSRRRGLLKKFNPLTGRTERVDHTTIQMVRSGDGERAPHMHTPEILRSVRSKHVPHVGKKQRLKAILLPKAELALNA